jgi:hypothetical protein
MLATLIFIALVASALVLIVLAVIVVGIRREPRRTELSDVAPSPFTVVVRRMVGLHVRRPISGAANAHRQEHGSPGTPAKQPRATT